MKNYAYINLSSVFGLTIFVALGGVALAQGNSDRPAGTTCDVAGVTIDCDDANITDAHDPNCLFLHYHGELNGVSDPDPNGCGHGMVESVAPPAPAPSSAWNRFTDWLDVAFQSISGGFSPKTVSDSVDTTKDAAPSIKENIDTIDEYRESVPEGEDTLGIYNNLDDVPENPTISQRFFRWFNNLTSSDKKTDSKELKQDSEIKVEGLEGLKTR